MGVSKLLRFSPTWRIGTPTPGEWGPSVHGYLNVSYKNWAGDRAVTKGLGLHCATKKFDFSQTWTIIIYLTFTFSTFAKKKNLKNEYSALQFRPLRFSMNVLYFHWIKIDHSTTKEYKFFFQMKLIAFYNLLENVSRGIPWQLTLPRSKIFPDF